MTNRKQGRWASRLGVILAVAGSAIGLGNFLRFPTQVAHYGAGAFIIPYLCALVFLGLPLMWMEWSLGRYGGIWGRHSLPGIYDAATQRPWAKYLGVLGLYVPFIILVYYTVIESWVLGFSLLSLPIASNHHPYAAPHMTKLLHDYLAGAKVGPFAVPTWGLLALGITLAVNFLAVYRGISRGLERINKVAIPLLFLLSAVLVARVFTQPKAGIGLNFLWDPNFHALSNPDLWLAAAGQVLFTLSLGLGAVITSSSYLRKGDDVALSGLTSASLSQVAEVILSGSIAVPAMLMFLFANNAGKLTNFLHSHPYGAEHGPFSLALLAMPNIFVDVPKGEYVALLWFLLLFLAGLTSSIMMLRTMVAFFHDEMGWSRQKATFVLLIVTVLYLVPVVLFINKGFLAEMDFWAVNLLLPLGALIELFIFLGVLGIKRGWEGITTGAIIRVPKIFRWILQFVTPVYLVALLGGWAWHSAVPMLSLKNVDEAVQPYLIASRVLLGVSLLAMLLLVRYAWRRQRSCPLPPPAAPAAKEANHVA